MSYMSYCKFEGTRSEIRSCIGTVYDHLNQEAEFEVSDREIHHFREMVEEIAEFFRDLELLDESGHVNENELDEVCAQLATSYTEEETEDEDEEF